MTTELLKSAYFHHRARAVGTFYPRAKSRGPYMNPAHEALAAARDDVSAYRAAASAARAGFLSAKDTARAARVWRYSSSPWRKPYGAVTWQPVDERTRERFAFVEDPEAAGLRFVGKVEAESYGGRDVFSTRETCGWYTDPYGDASRDGSGLCWGEVYQLPGRNGRARFVAGYRIGDSDGLMVDFGNVCEAERGGCDWDAYTLPDASREAARMADEHARVAAEHEREYQTAWQAGSQWAAVGAEIAQLREGALEDLATRRALRADLERVGVPLDAPQWTRACAMVRERVADALEAIARLRAKRDELERGNADPLLFYPSDELRAAFADGAGISPASQL